MKVPPDMERKILAMAGLSPTPKRSPEIPLDNAAILAPWPLVSPTSHGDARFVLTIDGWHPARLNALLGSHHMEAARRKKEDAEILARACYLAGVSRAIGKRRVRLAVILAKGQRKADPDAYFKSLHDGLVLAGALVDDGDEWVELTPPTYEFSDGRASRIVIEDI